MKGHVAPENLNGGLNNQTSASIVFDRHPSCLSLWGMACLRYSSPCRDGASGSDMTAVTQLQGAPLRLVTGAYVVTYTPPTSLHHAFPSPPTPGFAGCWNALSHPRRESVASVHSPMECAQVRLCVHVSSLCSCVCVRVCVYCSRTQRDSLSQWRAPV